MSELDKTVLEGTLQEVKDSLLKGPLNADELTEAAGPDWVAARRFPIKQGEKTRLTWAKRLAGRRVLFFGDNESARMAMIKAYSPVLSSLQIILQCITWDFQNGCLPWYARVPTEVNIADQPSRLVVEGWVKAFGATAVKPVFPEGGSPARWI